MLGERSRLVIEAHHGPVCAIDEVGRGNIRPVYVIQGAERILVSRAIEALRQATVGGGPRAIAEDHFDADTTRPATVIDACRLLPMLSMPAALKLVVGADWFEAPSAFRSLAIFEGAFN